MSRVDNVGGILPEAREEDRIFLANAAFASTTESNIDPWKRTISQLSMGSMMNSELTMCRVEVEIDGTEGPFYDRHRVYRVSVVSSTSEINNNGASSGSVKRRYKDFCWIHDFLTQKYTFRTIPALPPKKINGTAFYTLNIYLFE